jgi:hypothetical protein
MHARKEPPRRLRACSAILLAALVASGCGTTMAVGGRRATSPTEATVLLARLPDPPGFRRAQCHPSKPFPAACFTRARVRLRDSRAVSESWMETLVDGLGVTADPSSALCSPIKSGLRATVRLLVCSVSGTVAAHGVLVDLRAVASVNTASRVVAVRHVPLGAFLTVVAQGSDASS